MDFTYLIKILTIEVTVINVDVNRLSLIRRSIILVIVRVISHLIVNDHKTSEEDCKRERWPCPGTAITTINYGVEDLDKRMQVHAAGNEMEELIKGVFVFHDYYMVIV